MYYKFLVLIFIYTVFGFKLSLLGSANDEKNSSLLGSIRIDDIIIVLFLIVYFLKGRSGGYFLKKKPVALFLLYVSISLFSTIYNSAFGEVDFISSLLFTLRPLEYCIYIALGYELGKTKFSPDKTLKFYVVYCLVLIIGQTLGIIGGLSNFSFNRAIANTGGPWELAAVSAFLMMYFLLKRNTIFGGASGLILLLTQSRITLVGTLITILFRNLNLITSLLKKKLVLLSFLGLVIVGLSSVAVSLVINEPDNRSDSNSGVTARFESIGNNDTISTINDIFTNTNAAINRQDYFNRTYGDGLNDIITNAGNGDASAFIRFTRWITLIKTASGNVINFLIGLGPSYAGMAVDGNYVRMFVETGIIGLFAYIIFLVSCLKHIKQKLLKDYIIILVITALFIDIFVTFKAMFFLWFFYGFYLSRNERDEV